MTPRIETPCKICGLPVFTTRFAVRKGMVAHIRAFHAAHARLLTDLERIYAREPARRDFVRGQLHHFFNF